MLEINQLDFFLTYNSQALVIILFRWAINYISSVWSYCIYRVGVVQCVILNIKSENQALFLQRMHNFCIYYLFNWLLDNNYA